MSPKVLFFASSVVLAYSTTALADADSFLKRLAPVSEGSFKAGVFYDNIDSFTATLGLDQENLFGTDEHLKIDLMASTNRSAFTVSLTDADIYESPWSRTFSFTSQQFQENPDILRNFQYFSTNSQISFSRSIDSTKSVSIAFGHDLLDFGRSTDLPLTIANSSMLHGNRASTTYVKVEGHYSTLAGDIYPMSGSAFNAGLELGKADKINYSIARFGAEYVHSFGDRFFARFRMASSAGKAQGSEYPFNKTFMAGGAGSVRGYKFNSLGPLSTLHSSGEPVAIGGKYALSTSIEAGFLLGSKRNFAAFAFFDAGNVGNTREAVLPKNLAKSRGIGLRWISPLGPVDLSYAEAIEPTNPYITEKLQLSIGRTF